MNFHMICVMTEKKLYSESKCNKIEMQIQLN